MLQRTLLGMLLQLMLWMMIFQIFEATKKLQKHYEIVKICDESIFKNVNGIIKQYVCILKCMYNVMIYKIIEDFD